MLTSFVLSMAIAAPVPVAPAAPAQTGPLPRLMEVKTDTNGKVTVTVIRTEKQKVQVAVGRVGGAGANPPPAVVTREVMVPKMIQVELAEVKDLTITTADGKKVDVADAVKQLKNGSVVIVSADGKPVNPHYLKLFKDDVLVFTSPELVGPTVVGGGGFRPLPPVGVAPAVPLPAVPAPGGVLPVQPPSK